MQRGKPKILQGRQIEHVQVLSSVSGSAEETEAAVAAAQVEVDGEQQQMVVLEGGDDIGWHHHVAPAGESAVRSVSESLFGMRTKQEHDPDTIQVETQSSRPQRTFDLSNVHGETTVQLVTVTGEDGNTHVQLAGAQGVSVPVSTAAAPVGTGEDVLYVEEVDMEALSDHPPGSIITGPNGETYMIAGADDDLAAAAAGGASGVIGAGGQFIELPPEQVQALLADARPIKYVPSTNDSAITYRCPQCPSFFVNASAFTKHMKERHASKVFVCRQCDNYFTSLSDLFLHARRVHVDPKKPRKNPEHYRFHCDECAYMTNNGGTFEAHKRAHTGEKPYSCDICGKRFAQKANMKTHKARHVERDRPFSCDICHKNFTTNDIYLAHLRTREHELREHFQMMASSNLLLECLGCSTNFDSIYGLKKHTRSCKIVRTLVTKFRCIPCNAYVSEVADLKNHVKGHDGQQVGVIGCPVCGERGFPGFNQLNHHITRAHALRVARRHVCRYCFESFESKEEMQGHVDDAHAEEKAVRGPRNGPFFCKYRGCSFVTEDKNNLTKHHSLHAMNRDDVDQTLIKSKPSSSYYYEDYNPPKKRKGRPKKDELAFTPVQEMALAQAGIQVQRGRSRMKTAANRIRFLGPEDMSSDEDYSEGSDEDEDGNWKPPPGFEDEPIMPREPTGDLGVRLPSPPPKPTVVKPRGGATRGRGGRGRGGRMGYSASASFANHFAQQQSYMAANPGAAAATKRLPAWFESTNQNQPQFRTVAPHGDDDDEDYQPPPHILQQTVQRRNQEAANKMQELTVVFVKDEEEEHHDAQQEEQEETVEVDADMMRQLVEAGVLNEEMLEGSTEEVQVQ